MHIYRGSCCCPSPGLALGNVCKCRAVCGIHHTCLDTRIHISTQCARNRRPQVLFETCAATLPGAGRGIIVCCGAESTGTGLNPRADVWALTLDGDEGTWVQLLADDAPNAPPARNAATLTPMGSGELLLHGGWRPFVQTFGDSHILKVHSE